MSTIFGNPMPNVRYGQGWAQYSKLKVLLGLELNDQKI